MPMSEIQTHPYYTTLIPITKTEVSLKKEVAMFENEVNEGMNQRKI